MTTFDECQNFEWILKIYQQSPVNVNIRNDYQWVLTFTIAFWWMLLRIIKTLSYLEWWAENSILLNLYSSLVRSKLDYGSICYGNSNCNISKIIDPVHNTGLRCAAGAFKSSPISSLLTITGEPPLQYRRIRLTLNTQIYN